MNLMFWKKKNVGESSAKTAQQDADDQAAVQKSPDSESSDAETPKQPGLFARMKLSLVALIRHSKKTPAPDEEEAEEPAEDTHRRSTHDSEDRSDTDAETSEKPGFFAHLKAKLFGTKKVEEEAEGDETERRPAKHEAEHATEVPAAEEAAESEHSWKGWIIGGVILLLILLAAGGYFALDYLLPPLKRSNIAHETVKAYRNRQALKASSQQAEPPLTEAPQATPPPAEIEMPRNEAQPPAEHAHPTQSAQPARQRDGSTPPTSSKGDLVVGSKNPKDTAMSLKEAIKAMNAESGEPARKPAR